MSSILDLIRQDKNYSSDRSVQWFRTKIATLAGSKLSSIQMLGQMQKEQVRISQLMPGSMYMFVYAAKHRETLPFYDKFPLIIPFSKDAKSFHGLNFHYLPPMQRVLLLDNLMQLQKRHSKNRNDYLRISWAMLSAAAKTKHIQPCVKMYLNGYVRSMFIEIPIQDWPAAILLPTENFAGASREEVWKQSRK